MPTPNEVLDSKGWHARKCRSGGSRNARHNDLCKWHAGFHKAVTGNIAAVEQRVPAWDRVDPRTGQMEEARLDLAIRDPVTARPIFVDWSVTCEHSDNASRRQARANNDGRAAAQMVD